jgi:acetyl-CoA acetyltransferase
MVEKWLKLAENGLSIPKPKVTETWSDNGGTGPFPVMHRAFRTKNWSKITEINFQNKNQARASARGR